MKRSLSISLGVAIVAALGGLVWQMRDSGSKPNIVIKVNRSSHSETKPATTNRERPMLPQTELPSAVRVEPESPTLIDELFVWKEEEGLTDQQWHDLLIAFADFNKLAKETTDARREYLRKTNWKAKDAIEKYDPFKVTAALYNDVNRALTPGQYVSLNNRFILSEIASKVVYERVAGRN
jgi:hypothetical protein